jgi:hypothetical protein
LTRSQEQQEERQEKTLLNSFPFSAGVQEHGSSGHHGQHPPGVEHDEDASPNLRQLVQLGRQYGPAMTTPPWTPTRSASRRS